jgi:glycosyltransferase involved in cell wall biosynthesis
MTSGEAPKGGVELTIDATAIHERSGGAGRYVRELVRHLAEMGAPPALLLSRHDGTVWSGARQQHHIGPDRRASRLLWEQTRLLHVLSDVAPLTNVLHSPHYTMPERVLTRTGRHGPLARVVTIHDATWLTRPHDHQRLKVPLFQRAMKQALRLADAVIVPTAAVETSLRNLIHRIEAPITVVHHGVDRDKFAPPNSAEPDGVATLDEDAKILRRLGVRAPYVLHLGAIEPRKNVDTLCAAVDMAAADRSLPPEVSLVLAGQAWPGMLATLPPQHRVPRHLLGWVVDRDAIALMRGAAVFVYASSEEGFGLPVVEALAAGAVVVTSNVGATAEVAAGAAYLVSPRDVSALASAIVDAMTNGRQGLAQPVIASWADCAAKHHGVYAAALARLR